VSIGETKSKTFEVGDGIQDGADHRKSNATGLSAEEQAKIKVWQRAMLQTFSNMLFNMYCHIGGTQECNVAG
jgi:hypothetical protein